MRDNVSGFLLKGPYENINKKWDREVGTYHEIRGKFSKAQFKVPAGRESSWFPITKATFKLKGA